MTAEIVQLDSDVPCTPRGLITWLYKNMDSIKGLTACVHLEDDMATLIHDERPIPEIVCDCRQLALYGDSLLGDEE